MLPALVAMSGPLSGATLPLTDLETSIGREAGNRVPIADHSVSPRHCVITCERRTRDDSTISIPAIPPSSTLCRPATRPLAARRSDSDRRVAVRARGYAKTTPSATAVLAHVADRPASRLSTTVMRREEVLADTPPATGYRRPDCRAISRRSIRITAAINAVRGLVSLKRPLLELIADVVPAARGARSCCRRDRSGEIASAVGWSRWRGSSARGAGQPRRSSSACCATASAC